MKTGRLSPTNSTVRVRAPQAAAIGAANPDDHHQDLLQAIEKDKFPNWTVKVMPAAEAANYRFNPFDLTKVCYYKDYPLIAIASSRSWSYNGGVTHDSYDRANVRSGPMS